MALALAAAWTRVARTRSAACAKSPMNAVSEGMEKSELFAHLRQSFQGFPFLE